MSHHFSLYQLNMQGNLLNALEIFQYVCSGIKTQLFFSLVSPTKQ